jgi:hypothetical protein
MDRRIVSCPAAPVMIPQKHGRRIFVPSFSEKRNIIPEYFYGIAAYMGAGTPGPGNTETCNEYGQQPAGYFFRHSFSFPAVTGPVREAGRA